VITTTFRVVPTQCVVIAYENSAESTYTGKGYIERIDDLIATISPTTLDGWHDGADCGDDLECRSGFCELFFSPMRQQCSATD